MGSEGSQFCEAFSHYGEKALSECLWCARRPV